MALPLSICPMYLFSMPPKLFLTHQMRILDFIYDGNVVELDVQVLVDRLESAADEDIILQLDGDLVLDQRLEEAEEEHGD
jgi:hypothetical protein